MLPANLLRLLPALGSPDFGRWPHHAIADCAPRTIDLEQYSVALEPADGLSNLMPIRLGC